MWCKVVTALEAAHERKTVAGKEPEGSEENGSPGLDHVSVRSLQNSRRNSAAEKGVVGVGGARGRGNVSHRQMAPVEKPGEGEDSRLKQAMMSDCDAATAAMADLAELKAIDAINEKFEGRYNGRLSTDLTLTRGLVSFQANKSRSVYRWYKFKEAFSAGLVESLLTRHGVKKGLLLDPFAGSGTALFASSGVGLRAEGIELLPIGQRVIETKQLIDAGLGSADIAALSKWASDAPWRKVRKGKPLPELRITKGAYPEETAESMRRLLAAIDRS